MTQNALTSNPRAYFRWLVECGIDIETAKDMSGYRTQLDLERERLNAIMTYIWASILVIPVFSCLGYVVWNSVTQAHAADTNSLNKSELALVACLNEKWIKVGDEFFSCSRVEIGRMK